MYGGEGSFQLDAAANRRHDKAMIPLYFIAQTTQPTGSIIPLLNPDFESVTAIIAVSWQCLGWSKSYLNKIVPWCPVSVVALVYSAIGAAFAIFVTRTMTGGWIQLSIAVASGAIPPLMAHIDSQNPIKALFQTIAESCAADASIPATPTK